MTPRWLRAPRRISWSAVVLGILVVGAVALFATGRLQWRGGGATKVADGSQSHGGEGEKGEHAEGEGRVKGDKVVLDAEAMKAAGIRAEPAGQGSVPVTLQLMGEVQLPDDRMAHVTPRVAGIVREIHRGRGDAVVAGTPLLTVESTDLGEARAAYAAALRDVDIAEANVRYWEARRQQGFDPAQEAPGPVGWVELDQAIGEYAAALTDKAVAERNLARMRQLEERGLRSRTEVMASEADFNRAAVRVDAALRRLKVLGTSAQVELARAKQRVEAARSKLRAFSAEPGDGGASPAPGAITSRFIVRSPIAGVVADRHVTLGETVDATSKIFSIADASEVWVTAALYDRDVAAARPGTPAVVRVQGLDLTFRGQVVQLGTQVNEKTRTLPLRVLVRNQPLPATGERQALRPGMFATVALEISRKAGVVVVPLVAVQTLDGRDTIFVETPLSEGAAFQRRPVVLGARDERVVEVVEGVKAGERVVIANAYLLKSEFEKAKIGEGHAH